MFRLITRTLTKYPVDYALFRELLQNSADAKAEDVVISFGSTIPGGLTKENITDIGSCEIDRLTVKNNGQYFKEDDWNRLKEIAKGNPDESKIGAFGVGFYSVFELTDEPLVHSGTTVMSFYYSGDQLCYRRDTIEDSNKWTVIDLPYRESKSLPVLSQFIAFLTQSFALVPLHSIELVVDGITLLSLKKTMSPIIDLDLPRNLNYYSPDKTLRLKSWSSEAFQITITYMNITQISEKITGNSFLNFGFRAFSAFVPSSKNPSDSTKVTAFLRKITGKLDVNVSSSFAKKMKETVMKPPPKEAIISMLIENKDEKELSEIKAPLSDYVFPKEINDAKIYIGFPTKQSTSFHSHVAINQLIPTMERTAVDMSNAYVKDWNKQILTMAGVISRTIFEHEFSILQKRSPNEKLFEDAIYLMNRFDFQKSAPDQSVGSFIAYGFWKCAKYIPLPSQKGILPSSEVRLANDAKFIEELAIVPQIVIDKAESFLKRAVDLGYLKKISPGDVANELQRGTLTHERFSKVISWCYENLRNGNLSDHELREILQSAIVLESKNEDGSDNLVVLGQITTYQNNFDVPNEYPLPSTCLPSSLVALTSIKELETLGWKPLDIVSWLNYAISAKDVILTEKNMLVDSTFAEVVLSRLSRYWMTFNLQEQEIVKRLLVNHECLPTQLGLKYPTESYFEPISLFPNLPVKTAGLVASKQFLLDLGVRESVDVAFVLKRINNPDPSMKWSTLDVVKYLTNVQSTLKRSDWDILKESSFFEAEDGNSYKASELYSPDADLVKLGFPCLKWSFWHDDLPEAKFIYALGLVHHPKASTILSRADDSFHEKEKNLDGEKAILALRYYLKNYERNKYSNKVAFKTTSKCIPSVKNGTKIKCCPSECFLNQKVGQFGVAVVDESFIHEAFKFNIREEPSIGSLVTILINNPPKSVEEGDKKFSYLSVMASSLTSADKNKLKESRFIPIEKKTKENETVIIHTLPSMVFFSKPSHSNNDSNRKFYNDFFDFVNFSPSARPFLTIVGVRDEPNITEITRILVDEPISMYNLAASNKMYIELLHQIIDEWKIVSQDYALVSKMKHSKFLLGIKYESNPEGADDSTSEKGIYQLASVDEVILSDDVSFFNIFKYHILSPPPDDQLENFYELLGCKSLRQIVEETQSIGPLQPSQQTSEEIKKKLLERAFLYLESTRDTPHSNALKNLEKLQVKSASSITIERRLKLSYWSSSSPVKESISACLHREPGSGYYSNQSQFVLYIVPHMIDWYDISQAIIGLLLKKPSPDSVIVLETMLTSNLKKLQRKGYNVNRILLKLQKEQEEIDKQKEVEMERQRRKTQEKLKKEKEMLAAQHEVTEEQKTSTQTPIPQSGNATPPPPYKNGSVQDQKNGTDPNQLPPVLPPKQNFVPPVAKPRSFFNKFFKPQSASPTSASEPSGSNSFGTAGSNHFNNPRPGSVGRNPKEGEQAKEVDSTPLLERGIAGSRPFENSFLSSPARPSVPGAENVNYTEKECDSSEAKELVLATRLEGGPSVYISEGMSFTEEMLVEAGRFKSILFIISQHIYGINWSAIHIFLNTRTRVIAFNYGGSLFFNLAYFLNNSMTVQNGSVWDPVSQLDYWFTVFAHELAHNLCEPHGATHSYYTENYIQKYLARYKIESNKLMSQQKLL